jgi:hypothetical protein
MVLDDHMPVWDVREHHSVEVAASAERTLAAALVVTRGEVRSIGVLMGIRSLGLRRRGRPDAPLLDGFTRMGFGALGEAEHEVAYGGVGRFWTPSGGLRRVAPEDFDGFAEPGYAKAGFNFLVAPGSGGGCVLSTETRVLTTDAHSRRRFRLYWTVIRPGSGLIRRDWLRAIRARAER